MTKPDRPLLQRPWVPWLLGVLLLLGVGALQQGWLAANALPNGHQNEYLHVGNALDLWQAWAAHDWDTFGELLQGNYWPPGFYLWPWPLFRVFGASHWAMVTANMGHLALLLAAVFLLGRDLGSRRGGLFAMVGVVLLPTVTGNLMRYEPSVALTAWVTLGAWALLRSRSFKDWRFSLLFGALFAIGLMMDRLSVFLFLSIPALVELGFGLRDPEGRGRRLAIAGGVIALMLLTVGPWHLDFVEFHLHEVTSQSNIGEIDSAGTLTEKRSWTAWTTWFWYALAVLDGQAGIWLGLALFAGLGWSLTKLKTLRLPVVVIASSLLIFTLILKKQAFYSLPMLGCWVVLACIALDRVRFGPWVALGLALVGGVQLSDRVWGTEMNLPGASIPALPERWVTPRHPMALPPARGQLIPAQALLAELDGAQRVVVFGEDHDWYEGYVVLGLREGLEASVHGVIGDPQGAMEFVGAADHVVVIRESPDAADWPSESELYALLAEHHYSQEEVALLVAAFGAARLGYERVGEVPWQEGRVVVWGRPLMD